MLYLDYDVIEFCKARGINMSKEAESYFRVLMGSEVDDAKVKDRTVLISKLEGDLAEARREQRILDTKKQRKMKEEKKAALKKFIEILQGLNSRRQSDKHAEIKFAELSKKVCEEFGLNRAELLDFIERKKVLK